MGTNAHPGPEDSSSLCRKALSANRTNDERMLPVLVRSVASPARGHTMNARLEGVRPCPRLLRRRVSRFHGEGRTRKAGGPGPSLASRLRVAQEAEGHWKQGLHFHGTGCRANGRRHPAANGQCAQIGRVINGSQGHLSSGASRLPLARADRGPRQPARRRLAAALRSGSA